MQQTQQRELPERMSWARAMIFATGFFFIAAIFIGQLPGYVFLQMTAATLQGLEIGSLALAAVGIGVFIVIQVIVLLFDPKPLVSPRIFSVLGFLFAAGGLALLLWAVLTGNQYFPHAGSTWNPVLGGTLLWFEPGAVDFAMVGATLLGIGIAMMFYAELAVREQRNPDRSDPGTTPAIRTMIGLAASLLLLFMVFYTFVDDKGLARFFDPTSGVAQTQLIIDLVINSILGIAIFLALGAFALRLHYLMRPVRKRTMSRFYLIGALGLAQMGVIFFLVWLLVYPAITWMHSWTFIGLGDYLTLCAKKTAVPASCSFSAQFGYLVDAIITTTFFFALMGSIWAWKTNRNLVVIGGVVITAVLGLATLLVHLHPNEVLIALLLCGGILIVATLWTNVARREFAIVGENNLGCIGMWLVVGTCLFIYLASFAFFAIPGFNETEPNIPFVPGVAIYVSDKGRPDAIIMMLIIGALAGIQFFFLVRNRYKV
jgi:hypothetical protein